MFSKKPEQELLHDFVYNNNKILISTLVKRKFFGSLHLLAVDCDSKQCYESAHKYLSRMFNVETVQSSPDHYWLITDYVDKIGNVLKKMSSVPGVDPKYVNSCRSIGAVVFRAFPKKVGFPVMGDSVFPPGLARDWIIKFKNHFNSSCFKALTILLQAKLGIHCPNCKSSQNSGTFCSQCGTKLSQNNISLLDEPSNDKLYSIY